MDGSYEFVWDKRFPANGDSLWPNGKLLQLQRFGFSSSFREKRHIVVLTPMKLVIAEQPERDPDLPWGVLDDGSGYRFYNGELKNEEDFDTANLTKLELMSTLANQGIGIWAQNDVGKSKRVFRAQVMTLSKVLKDVAEESLAQGIGKPGHSLIPEKGVAILRRQLLHREVERQFKKAAPQIEVVLLGEQMPEEDFRRIIK
jgi:hypothetical protein